MKDILLNNYDVITNLVEILAAITGTYYLSKGRYEKLRPFVIYLWITVFVEVLSHYGKLMPNNFDNKLFILVKNSPFCRNTWMYNIYCVLTVIFVGKYYYGLLSNAKFKKIIKILAISYSTIVIIYFLFSGTFFIKSIPYNFILETLVIVMYVFLYYLELIRSDNILNFSRSPHFYISIALLFWFLIITPLFIFNNYFRIINQDFISFRKLTLLLSNISMYLCFTFGFLISLRKRK